MIRYIGLKPCDKKENHNECNGNMRRDNNCVCSLSCKLSKHIQDSDQHVTKENKDYWNSKVDQSQIGILNTNINNVVNNLQDFQDSVGDIDDFVKHEDIEDLVNERQVSELINNVLDTNDFATKQYVKDYTDQYSTSNFYTKQQIDNLLNTPSPNYEITSLEYNNGYLSIIQDEVGNTKTIYIGDKDQQQQTMSQEQFDDMLRSSNAVHSLTAKNKTYNPVVQDVDISQLFVDMLPEQPDIKSGYYKPYFKNTTYVDSLPKAEWPTNEQAPSKESGWTPQQVNPASGEYTWMTQVFIDSNDKYGVYMDPIRITGEKGQAGKDGSFYEYIYKRYETQQSALVKPENQQVDGFVPDGWNDHPEGVDSTNKYEYSCCRVKSKETDVWGDWVGPYIWSAYGLTGTDGDGVEYIYYSGFGKPEGNIKDPSKWDYSTQEFQNDEYILPNSGWVDNPVDLTEQGQKQFVSVRKKKEGLWRAYSEPTLWSYYAVDGATQQASGSPLRVKGQFVPGEKYYDGTELIDGYYYQDVVIYNNVYYACVKTNSNTFTPDKNSTCFSAFSMNESMFANMIIANKAYIQDLSSREVVVMDGDNVVAGITSGKSKTDSDISTYNKGNVRIWAGQPEEQGNLITAPFTVSDSGVVKSSGQNGTIYLQDGTIYFIDRNTGNTYHLGLNSSGKPDWLTEKQYVYTYTFFQNPDINDYTVTLYTTDNSTYYSDVNLTKKATGTYYLNKYSGKAVITDGGSCFISFSSGIDLRLYQKITIQDGTMQSLKPMIAIGYRLYINDTDNTFSKGSKCYFYPVQMDLGSGTNYFENTGNNEYEHVDNNKTEQISGKYYILQATSTKKEFQTYAECTKSEDEYTINNVTLS